MQKIKSPIKQDDQSETENLQFWINVEERRLAELRAGNACEYTADEVFQNIRAEFACDKKVITPISKPQLASTYRDIEL